MSLGEFGIAVGHHDSLAAQLGHVGERVADHQRCREHAGLGLDRLGPADVLAVDAGLGDALVAPDEHRQAEPRRRRPGAVAQHLQQQPRRPLTGVGEIDMRVGVQRGEPRRLAQHACGQNAVQVERHDEGHVGPEHDPCALEQITFRIELALGPHCTVQRPVDGIDTIRGGGLQRPEQLVAQPRVARGRQLAGAAGEGAVDRHEIQLLCRFQDLERAADIGARATPLGEQLRAPADLEVFVAAGHWIEGRDLLLAFDDEDALLGHFASPQQVTFLPSLPKAASRSASSTAMAAAGR